MILYLDTSSLVKIFVEEDGSQEVRELVDQAAWVSTSVVAYPESNPGARSPASSASEL